MNITDIIASAQSARPYSQDLAAKLFGLARAEIDRAGTAATECDRCGSLRVLTIDPTICALCGATR